MAEPAVVLDNIIRLGMEIVSRYYGPYRGIVKRNDDPEKRGRIQAHVPRTGADVPLDIWIDPSFAGAGSTDGTFWPPDVNDGVWVFFDNGDASTPVCYIGGWLGTNDLPAEFSYTTSGSQVYPDRRGFITRMGHSLTFCDEVGKEEVVLSWHQAASADPAKTDRTKTANRDANAGPAGKTAEVRMTPNGSVMVSNSSGITILLDSAGALKLDDGAGNTVTLDNTGLSLKSTKKITLDAPTIDLKATASLTLGDGASSPVVKGREFLSSYAGHVHPFVSGIPGIPLVTAPPVPLPPAPVVLSFVVKTK